MTFLSACDRDAPTSGSPPTSAATAIVSAAPPAASSVASDSVAPSAREAKRWNGTYESKRVALETPEKVSDVTWKQDDGTQALGKGSMTLQVSDGIVTGEATGPLGPQRASGMFDGETLRLTLYPEDPTTPEAMTGSGLGEVKDGALRGALRCAGPKGVVVRELVFELKPAP
jgi:hypothetical protein